MAMSGDAVAHDLTSPMSLWAARCLDTARAAAVFTAVTAPI
jgi:hypothetical protein